MGPLSSKLGDISKQHRRREISLDVGLLEWLDLAGEDMVETEYEVMLDLDSFCDHVERKQRGFCAASLSALFLVIKR